MHQKLIIKLQKILDQKQYRGFHVFFRSFTFPLIAGRSKGEGFLEFRFELFTFTLFLLTINEPIRFRDCRKGQGKN